MVIVALESVRWGNAIFLESREHPEENRVAVNMELTRKEIETLPRAFPLNVMAATLNPEKQQARWGSDFHGCGGFASACADWVDM